MDPLREQLEAAARDGVLVAVERAAFEDAEDLGFVVGVGEALLALERVSESIRLDGVSILRLDDVSDLEDPHAHADFVTSALRLRGETRREAPSPDLGSWAGALRSIALESGATRGEAPIVALHEESDDEAPCRIGVVTRVAEATLEMVEIDPDADWATERSEVGLATLTRIDFGGAYEAALRLVGGPCPARPEGAS